jgi:hypothetical protein
MDATQPDDFRHSITWTGATAKGANMQQQFNKVDFLLHLFHLLSTTHV